MQPLLPLIVQKCISILESKRVPLFKGSYTWSQVPYTFLESGLHISHILANSQKIQNQRPKYKLSGNWIESSLTFNSRRSSESLLQGRYSATKHNMIHGLVLKKNDALTKLMHFSFNWKYRIWFTDCLSKFLLKALYSVQRRQLIPDSLGWKFIN